MTDPLQRHQIERELEAHYPARASDTEPKSKASAGLSPVLIALGLVLVSLIVMAMVV
jgi:hypothetical protein